jgi:hypothetical protein
MVQGTVIFSSQNLTKCDHWVNFGCGNWIKARNPNGAAGGDA